MKTKDVLRRVWFEPYKDAKAPRFRLTLYDCHESKYGKTKLGYLLTMITPGTIVNIFEGEDFYCSPLHGIDSDETVEWIMAFLTTCPGDTPEQLEFCDQHAESLSCEVRCRFGRTK